MTSVDEIRQRLDIAEVVGESVALKRAGRTYKGLCPFHEEKTPSFIVSPDRQTWHCFGACSTGGDVFRFVMRRDGVEFAEALRRLAERAGVELVERDRTTEDRYARLRQANDAAALYFHSLLLNHPAAQPARDYLERRGLDRPTLERFQLGYSLNEWEALHGYLEERGFGEAELLEAGLLVEGDRTPYDRFRGRIIYPIRDDRGRVVGFGGRALDDTPPKYLNTAQGPLFDKGSILYGLDLAKDAIRARDTVVVVEGYMDVIAAHQHGAANVVASMGTALTERQIALLKRHSGNIVLALDADAAGQAAALRDVEALRTTAFAGGADLGALSLDEIRASASRVDRMLRSDLRVLELPAGQDPDDLLREDPDAWQKLVAGAEPYIEFRFRRMAAITDTGDPRSRAALAEALLPDVASIVNPMVREQYLGRLASLTRVDVDTLRRQVRSALRKAAAQPTPAAVAPEPRDRREDFVLALLFRYAGLRDEGLKLDPELFVHQENRAILDAWRTYMDSEVAREHLLPEIAPRIDELTVQPMPPFAESEAHQAFRDGVLRLWRSRLQERKRSLSAAVAEIEERTPPAEAVGLAATYLDGSPDADEAPDEDTARYIDDLRVGARLHSVEKALRTRRNTPLTEVDTIAGDDAP